MLAHTSTGLCEIKPSPRDVFAAANPRAKTPDEIQTRCLNPGPDTAASTPSLCVVAATRWASFSAGTEGEQVPRGRVEPPAQLISIVLQAPSSTRHPPEAPLALAEPRSHFLGGGVTFPGDICRDAARPAATEEVAWGVWVKSRAFWGSVDGRELGDG